MKWRLFDAEKPMVDVPVLWKGDSGYIAPHDINIVSGYYNPEYRPLSPCLDSHGECVGDASPLPTHWCYLAEVL
jgi:hypothetical protein